MWALYSCSHAANPKGVICLENRNRDLGDEAKGSPRLAGDRQQAELLFHMLVMGPRWPDHEAGQRAVGILTALGSSGTLRAHLPHLENTPCAVAEVLSAHPRQDTETTFIRPRVATNTKCYWD